ncbi:MAG TPA: secretin N-terminal domain-containing protein [Thermoanaerobaculia bacterium]|nr:secretin N-terminal domain-containing protein [Thermoanaerobaculia bacterium]
MPPVRRIVASFLWAVLVGCALHAQAPAKEKEELSLHAFTLKHQPAAEAMALVHPLLSKRGTVELQPGGNTLVVRDTPASLRRIVPVLREFDHPARPFQLEVFIVKASRAIVSPPVKRSDLPEELTQRLRQLLTYDTYEMQAQANLSTYEGQAVTYGMGSNFEVSFRLGTLVQGRRLKLNNFRVLRRTDGKAAPLIHTTLNLWLDQPMGLGLAKSESSREVLMVVLTVRPGEPGTRRAQ